MQLLRTGFVEGSQRQHDSLHSALGTRAEGTPPAGLRPISTVWRSGVGF